jgi:hypothetical protein
MMNEVLSFVVHVGDVNSIIRNYLLHYGYEDTLRSFETACGGMKSEIAHKSLQNRKSNVYIIYFSLTPSDIRKLILEGQIEEALNMTTTLYPDVLKGHTRTALLLHCQLFIELIHRGKVDDAITCAQSNLCEFRSKLSEQDERFLQVAL